MTFPSVVNTTDGFHDASSSSWTGVTYPGSISANNILLLFIGNDGNATFSGLPAGWALLGSQVGGSGSPVTANVHWKRATGSETGTFTITCSAGEQGVWQIVNISGAHTSTDPEIALTSGGSATPDPPSLDPTGWATDDTLWFAIAARDSGLWTFTGFPFTDGQFSNNQSVATSGAGLATCRTNSATGSLDPGTFTTSAAEDWAAGTVAIRPATSGLTLSVPVISIPALSQEPTHTLNFVFSVAKITATATLNAPSLLQNTISASVINAAPTIIAPGVFHEVTITRSVAQGSDDGTEAPGGSPSIGGTAYGSAVISHVGFRFQNVQVPHAAFVKTATITVTLTDSNKNDAEGSLSGQLIDDAPTFTTTDGDIDGRTKTTATVAWTTNDLGSAGAAVATPSLKSIVEEVAALDCWVPENSMVFFYVHNSTSEAIQVAGFNHATLDPALLSVTYLTTIINVTVDSISAPATMFTHSVAIQQTPITPGVISVATTMQAPTVVLFDQFVEVPKIDAGVFVNNPDVITTIVVSGLKVTLRDEPQTATVQDTSKTATITESSYAVTLQDTTKVTLEDQP